MAVAVRTGGVSSALGVSALWMARGVVEEVAEEEGTALVKDTRISASVIRHHPSLRTL